MKKINLILGIVSLIIAAGLTYANLVLPPESLLLMVAGRNVPWLGPIIFAVVGIVLLATSKAVEAKIEAEASKPAPVIDPAKEALNKRLETIFWGLFLIMLGGWTFIPGDAVPKALWDIALGVLFLGLNAARYFNGLRMSGFTTFLGILSVLAGIGGLLGLDLGGAMFLIILGAYLILKPWFDRHQFFGKAEQV